MARSDPTPGRPLIIQKIAFLTSPFGRRTYPCFCGIQELFLCAGNSRSVVPAPRIAPEEGAHHIRDKKFVSKKPARFGLGVGLRTANAKT